MFWHFALHFRFLNHILQASQLCSADGLVPRNWKDTRNPGLSKQPFNVAAQSICRELSKCVRHLTYPNRICIWIMTLITLHIKKKKKGISNLFSSIFVGVGRWCTQWHVKFCRLDGWFLEPHCSKQSIQTVALYFLLFLLIELRRLKGKIIPLSSTAFKW